MPYDASEFHVTPFVYDTLRSRNLHFSIEETQSRMTFAKPDFLDIEYTRTMMGFLLFIEQPLKIGMIGLGGGSLAKFCYRHMPHTHITVVEINPHVIALREQFAVPPDDERFQVVRGDGARFVGAHPAEFDVLLVDGYDYDGLPPSLSSRHFYDEACYSLRSGGVMAANIHSAIPGFQSLLDRVSRSFGSAALSVDDNIFGNAIVFAKKDGDLLMEPGQAERLPDTIDYQQRRLLEAAFKRVGSALKARDRTR